MEKVINQLNTALLTLTDFGNEKCYIDVLPSERSGICKYTITRKYNLWFVTSEFGMEHKFKSWYGLVDYFSQFPDFENWDIEFVEYY